MAITGTYNGVSIITLPSMPAPKQIQLTMNNIVAAPTNPFTASTLQVLQWPGGDYWSGQIALPRLVPGLQTATWSAFLAECHGKLNVFLLGDSSYTGPFGHVQGVPVVDGAQQPMAATLNTRGWTANSTGLLLPGDYLQVGYRLHRVLEPVNSDANGKAAMSLWPSLRDSLADGQQIILTNPAGLFRMTDNKQSVTIDETRLGAVSFNVVEAR